MDRAEIEAVLTLGLDVGGTKVAGGLVAPDGTVVSRRTAATEAGGRRDPAWRSPAVSRPS
jgi:glucokinase